MDNETTELVTVPGKTRKKRVPKHLMVLKRLEEENGVLTPQLVVDAARDESSPLHNTLEWDDTVGGEKFRLMQARLLINQIKVEFIGDDKQKAFINATITVENVPVRGYIGAENMLTDDEIYQQVLTQAIREVEYTQKKYKHIKELKRVINQKEIEKLKK